MKRLLGISLLVIFLVYFGDTNLFPHVHYENGKPFTHSHPYSGTPGHAGHSHSSQELNTIASLSLMLALLTWSAMATALVRRFADVTSTVSAIPYFFNPKEHFGLRAPPRAVHTL